MEEKLNSEVMVKGLDYFPSGSVIDGISAALLARCQIKKICATLCVTWPQNGYSVHSVKGLVQWLCCREWLGHEGDVVMQVELMLLLVSMVLHMIMQVMQMQIW
ncbi:uncharacterized protein LOC113274164 [Papaver somniferum]|uniref:uncharacterized protein LOC113274164 n=1 Tax=Papaver somniferum TaxID=3469 RepID=UPI000E6FB092|nr:uncharacterized protein LOC113274164 [Papaver somniferum]